jgi:hypothetical protein
MSEVLCVLPLDACALLPKGAANRRKAKVPHPVARPSIVAGTNAMDDVWGMDEIYVQSLTGSAPFSRVQPFLLHAPSGQAS